MSNDDKLEKMKTLDITKVCWYKNPTTIDGHNSLSRFPIKMIHTRFFFLHAPYVPLFLQG
jgi:hypothetical protein